MYNIRIKSRHPSHKILRTNLARLPVRSLVRLGSTTEAKQNCIEINSIDSIKISSDKKLMKEKFDEAMVKTAPWTFGNTVEEILSNLNDKDIGYQIVAKSRLGSRGEGNTLIDDEHHLWNWASGRDLTRYIFEKFFNYSLEYRLHITKDGLFYTCRKALRRDAEAESRWHRHIENSVWLLETNPLFSKPNSWDDIINDCVKALTEINADLLSFDVRVQGAINKKGEKRKYQDYILIECNSASSMKSTDDKEISVCAQRYLEVLPQLIMSKSEN